MFDRLATPVMAVVIFIALAITQFLITISIAYINTDTVVISDGGSSIISVVAMLGVLTYAVKGIRG